MSTKKTSIYEQHIKHGGKMVDFVGWKLPLEFGGLSKEHSSVRKHCGVFDVSHMGEIVVKGEKAEEFVQYIVTNDVKKLYDGKVLYTPMCYPNGGIVDDLLVYRINSKEYLLVVNASNTDKDFEWLRENNNFGVEISNLSDEYFQIAVQGPESVSVMSKCFGCDLSDMKFFHFKSMDLDGVNCLVSRTGYTGENGFEIYGPWKDGGRLFDMLISSGATPCGLSSRDVLRLEAALMLYGNDINQETTPIEAGLNFFVKLDTDDFIGKNTLLEQKKNGVKRKLTGFMLEQKAVPRHDYPVVDEQGRELGRVTSGTISPSLGKPLGLAYISSSAVDSETKLFVQIRKNRIAMELVKLPFLKKS